MIAPTTKDLAEVAGVSLATVDRVLNDRPNVSPKARLKVQNAIEQTGFVRNLAAVNLSRNRPYKFRFLFPEAGDQYLSELMREVEEAKQALRTDMTVVENVRQDMRDPHAVAKYLGTIEHSEIDGIAVMAPESPPVRDAISRLHERGVNVVQFLSGQENLDNFDFVGVNNFAAGATAGRIIGRFLRGAVGSVMVIAETMQSLDSIERRHGFDEIINSRFPDLQPLPSLETYGSKKRAEKIIANQIKHSDDVIAVYVLSSEARLAVETVQRQLNLQDTVLVVHERTPFSETALKHEEIDAIIAQNPGHAVRSALRILRARSEERNPIAAQESVRIEVLLCENL
ncbi:MAG: LacI family DNA-binding transcriptional regulator [Hyphomicrobiales bacterium]